MGSVSVSSCRCMFVSCVHPGFSTSINKVQVMQNAALITATGSHCLNLQPILCIVH